MRIFAKQRLFGTMNRNLFTGSSQGTSLSSPAYSQSKLVRVVKGRVLDVAVDIRVGAPTLGKHVALELTEDNHRMFFIPRGFAHGFAVLSEEAIFQYKCDNYYAPNSEGGLAWDDSDIGIDWKLPHMDVILSDKDQSRVMLKNLNSPFQMNQNLYRAN